MKKHLSLLPILLLVQCTIAQTDSTNVKQGEFMTYDNGMIYSETTMSQIGKLVDSLNLRFKICEPKTFHSLEQGYGTYLSITKNVKKARKAILQNVTLDQFIKHFPGCEIKKNNWVVKEQWFYEGKENVAYAYMGNEYRSLYPDVEIKNSKRGWVYRDYGDQIDALYVDELKSYTIPDEYARLIQYVDCMVDTTAMIFSEITLPDSSTYNLASNSKVQEFMNIAMDFEGKPETPSREDGPNEELVSKFQKNYAEWNKHRMVALDKKMQDANTFKLFNEAVDEAIARQNGFYLEVYADRYLPAKRILELRRSYQVHGACSADTRPREHAQRICELAAEAKQWDIFLRAHLDILNDNFSRNSDGSYAWQSRGTYVKELEEVGINTVALLVGTLLSSRDISKNHYTASPSRIGRSLAESKNREDAENLLLQMAKDDRLDIYNRIEMIYVLIFCSRYAKHESQNKPVLSKIEAAIQSLPKAQRALYTEVLKD